MGERPRKTLTQRQVKRQKADLLFSLYYQLGGERSLVKVRKVAALAGVRVSEATLSTYSSEFGWVRRVAELDVAMQGERDQELIAKVRKLESDEYALGRGMFGMAAKVLQGLKPLEMGAGEAVGLSREGDRLQRLALHLATEKVEIVVQVYSQLVLEVVNVFVRINALTDPEQRKRQFAAGVDAFVKERLAAIGVEAGE